MVLRVAAGVLCTMSLFAAQPVATVAEIIALVRSSIARNDADTTLAKALHKLKPSERLEDRAVEELESAGAGPKSVLELARLREASQTLPPPATEPEFPHDETPSVADQRRIVAAAQEIALHYARSLPDFICNEVVRRYDDVRGAFALKDTLEVKLSYFDQKENYRLLTVNGRPTIRPFEEVGGAVSEGEFGSMLFSLFSGESKAVFRWNHWTTLRKRVAHVFSFRITPENSNYRIRFSAGRLSGEYSTMAGQHGFVYVDRETNEILRIVAEADGIPADFPVRQSSTVLDYDFAKVGSRQFLLPIRADVRMSTSQVRTRNLVEFQGFRKFSGESTITFQ
jgi:hypothetical protein